MSEFSINEVLDLLTTNEKDVIIHRYAIDSDFKSTEEVSKIIGKSKTTVNQYEKKALRKLRHITRAKYFRLFPSNLLYAVFGSYDYEEVQDMLFPKQEVILERVRDDLMNHIDNKLKSFTQHAILQTDRFNQLMEALKGSYLYEFLEKINKMSVLLDKRRVELEKTVLFVEDSIRHAMIDLKHAVINPSDEVKELTEKWATLVFQTQEMITHVHDLFHEINLHYQTKCEDKDAKS